jgi:hypothetical protein
MIATIVNCRQDIYALLLPYCLGFDPCLWTGHVQRTMYDVHRRPINLVGCTYWLMRADMSQLVEWLNIHRHITCTGIIYFMIATKAAIQDVGLCVHSNPWWDQRG